MAIGIAASGSTRWKRLSLLGVHQLIVEASRPRFRAANRSRIRFSARVSMVLVAVVAGIDCVWLVPHLPESAARIITANALVAFCAFLAFRSLGANRHLSPEVAIFCVLAVVDLATAATIGISAGASVLCAGYVLLLPPVAALLVPWSFRLHFVWLATHGAAAVLMAWLAPSAAAAFDGPRTLLTLLVVASAASGLGYLMNLRARVTSFALIEQVRSMNRAARRTESTLRQLNARLEHTAWTDGLTGFGNRHALQGQLAAIRGRIGRTGCRYALLMLDLDHFKAINDTRGHFAGDDVLRRVASAIAGAIRTGDDVYRFGGEEFVAIIEVATDDDAWLSADRTRRAVEHLRIEHSGNRPFGVVTVSIGVSVIGPEAIDEPDDAWLQQADRALYQAKAEGRNRVVVLGGDPAA
jgi:diguanylate cyclase (GGDEF)-like protein